MIKLTENGEITRDPVGSIFLPESQGNSREIGNYMLALLMGRGVGAGLELDERISLRAEASEALERCQKIKTQMANVAIS